MTTLTVYPPTLSASNHLTHTALLNALAALHRLNQLGLRVCRLEASPVFGARLLLDEVSSPEALATLESGLLSRTMIGLSVVETRAAHVLGCQVEWIVRRSTRADVPEGREVAA